MKIVYLGSGKFGIDCLEAISASENDLALIVTQPPLPAGRGRKKRPTDVAKWASENNIPFIETANANSPDILEKIRSYKPELNVVIAFGQKMADPLIKIARRGTINVHGSLLPKYRGAAPINYPIIKGDKQTGITVSDVVLEMDAGDILAQAKTTIRENETAGQLYERLAAISPKPLLETIKKIKQNKAVYTPQDNTQVTYAPKLKKKDGYIDFAESAQTIKQKILGLSPWPGTAAIYEPKNLRVAILAAQVIKSKNPENLTPGTLDKNLNIICGTDALKITKIKPAGKTEMDFKVFTNGQNTKPGHQFKKIK